MIRVGSRPWDSDSSRVQVGDPSRVVTPPTLLCFRPTGLPSLTPLGTFGGPNLHRLLLGLESPRGSPREVLGRRGGTPGGSGMGLVSSSWSHRGGTGIPDDITVFRTTSVVTVRVPRLSTRDDQVGDTGTHRGPTSLPTGVGLQPPPVTLSHLGDPDGGPTEPLTASPPFSGRFTSTGTFISGDLVRPLARLTLVIMTVLRVTSRGTSHPSRRPSPGSGWGAPGEDPPTTTRDFYVTLLCLLSQPIPSFTGSRPILPPVLSLPRLPQTAK